MLDHAKPEKGRAWGSRFPEETFRGGSWGTECVGEWQYSNWPAGVFQGKHDSTWLIHFTYHQLVEHI